MRGDKSRMPTEKNQNDAQSAVPPSSNAHPPVSLDKFLSQMGISPVTGWRFRKRGWLWTINLAGRHYVPYEAILEFNHRAARGEFSRQLSNPKDNAKSTGQTSKSPKRAA
jgi:hypothetical protein